MGLMAFYDLSSHLLAILTNIWVSIQLLRIHLNTDWRQVSKKY